MDVELLLLREFDDSWDITSINLVRKANGCPLDLIVIFSKDDANKEVQFSNCEEYDCVEQLLEAESIKISKIVNSQREFGTYCIECFEETYSYFVCDNFSETNS